MSALDQYKLLVSKVEKAVETIKSLRAENNNLRQLLKEAGDKVHTLEGNVSILKNGNEAIESEIANAMKLLDEIDSNSETQNTTASDAAIDTQLADISLTAPADNNFSVGSNNNKLDIF